MALHSTSQEIVAASELLARELGISFDSMFSRESGLLLSFKKRGSVQGVWFKLDLLFPHKREAQNPSKVSLHVYRNGVEVDNHIDIDPKRITVFSDVEYILRRVNEEPPVDKRTQPEIPAEAFTLTYDELSNAFSGMDHDVSADWTGMTVSLHSTNNGDRRSVRLRFYEDPSENSPVVGCLNLMSGEAGSSTTGAFNELPVTVVKSVSDLVNIVDSNLQHNAKNRHTK